ncbi:MAG TPA: acetate--CoA ligase family protein [Acidimicrobiales bacterium]|nr:acetate--CoA ligase family protein [Acidimicrobiales bacterium]
MTEPGPGLRDVPLERFFHPRVVAVVGASGNRSHPANLLYRTVKRKVESEGGVVHPVNPTRDDIEGVPCYRSILDVPGDIDLAVIAGGDPLEGLKQVCERRPTFAMMFAAGFAESGPDGARAQAEIAELVRASGVYLLGPNTTLNSFLPLRADVPGPRIGLISHSGHQGRHLWQGEEIGIPLGYWAPTGNEVDLEFADFVWFFADQPEIGAIAAYIEGFKDGRTVMRAADHALATGTPIVIVKVGRSAAGEANALSHTAHLAGSDVVASGVFRQYGISRVESLDELLHTAGFLARAVPPTARGVAVYGISGGTLAHLTDVLVAHGLTVPELTPATQAALSELIPDYLRVSNPIDSGGGPSGDDRGRAILRQILDDPEVGVLVVPFVANAYHLSDVMAQHIVEAAATSTKPIAVLWGSPAGSERVYRDVLVPSGIPVFRTFGQCVAALRAYFDYHDLRARYTAPFTAASRRAGRALIELPAARTFSERDAKLVLSAYGVAVPTEVVVRSPDEARVAVASMGGPAVLKIASADIVHKSDLGLVRLGVGPAGADDAYEGLVATARRVRPDATIDGVLVAAQVDGGVEMAVGVTRDEVFGPAVMVGFGGVLVEVLGDVSVRVPPFPEVEARAMVDELRGRALLDGGRGRGPADVDALVAAIMSVQRLVLDHRDALAELDINPLIVGPKGAIAVDAFLRTR